MLKYWVPCLSSFRVLSGTPDNIQTYFTITNQGWALLASSGGKPGIPLSAYNAQKGPNMEFEKLRWGEEPSGCSLAPLFRMEAGLFLHTFLLQAHEP